MSSTNIDALIKNTRAGRIIPEADVVFIFLKLHEILIHEPSVLILQSPIVIIGDLHGQLSDVNLMIDTCLKNGADINRDKFLFMGDYVDRGYHSMNVFLLLALYKIKNPYNIFLLRGNHESRGVSMMYGFYNECLLNYGSPALWNMCNDVFDYLPLAALTDMDIFSVHGGISPSIPLIEMLARIDNIQELPQTGPLADLTWSDPDESTKNWRKSMRGAGYVFGSEACERFNALNRLSIVTRSHQLVMEGFRGFFGRTQRTAHKNPMKRASSGFFPVGEKLPDETEIGLSSGDKVIVDAPLVDVWSAPDYGYRSGNVASVMLARFPREIEYKMVMFSAATNRIQPGVPQGPTGYFA